MITSLLCAAFFQAHGAPIVFAGGSALIVAVDKLPAQAKNLQTLSAESDASRAKGTFELAGLKVAGPQVRQLATQAAIRAGLKQLADEASPGAWSVFYYSGLGTVTKEGSRGLACWDSAPTGSAQDLPLADLATWAEAVRAKEGAPLVILDACWTPVATSARSQTLSIRTVPKFLERSGSAKAGPFPKLPAIVLLSSGANGVAFEEKYRSEQNADYYQSGFSARLFERSLIKAALGEKPVFSQMLSEIIQEFSWLNENGVLLNQRPEAIIPPELQEAYNQPFLGLVPGAPGLARIKPFRTWEKLGVFVDVDPMAVGLTQQKRETALVAIRESLKKEFAGSDLIEVLDKEGIWPDRRILIGVDPTNSAGFSASISGSNDELIAGTNTLCRSVDPSKLVAAEQIRRMKKGAEIDEKPTGLTLSEALKKMALVRWLFRLKENQAPTSPAKISIEYPGAGSGSPTFSVGDAFRIRVKSDSEGVALVFFREEWVGTPILAFPRRTFPKTKVTAQGPLLIPGLNSSVTLAAPPGAEGMTLVRLVLASGSIPEADDFSPKGELAYLQSIKDLIQKGQVQWSVQDAVHLLKKSAD
jgi:hypothetical protein